MWGATILPSLKHPQGASFNPRSHVGSDGIAVDEHQGERFQSTLPCGERRVNRWSCVRRNRFQSTLPCGERLISDEHKNSVSSVSIHAPMWGATNDPRFWAMTKNVSIHAPMWGATGNLFSNIFGLSVSIHAPMWGATEGRFLDNIP